MHTKCLGLTNKLPSPPSVQLLIILRIVLIKIVIWIANYAMTILFFYFGI